MSYWKRTGACGPGCGAAAARRSGRHPRSKRRRSCGSATLHWPTTVGRPVSASPLHGRDTNCHRGVRVSCAKKGRKKLPTWGPRGKAGARHSREGRKRVYQGNGNKPGTNGEQTGAAQSRRIDCTTKVTSHVGSERLESSPPTLHSLSHSLYHSRPLNS